MSHSAPFVFTTAICLSYLASPSLERDEWPSGSDYFCKFNGNLRAISSTEASTSQTTKFGQRIKLVSTVGA